MKQRLSPIPQPDLVPRPDFKVSIKGVRMVYYPVKGQARQSFRIDGPRPRRRKSTAARSNTAGTRAAADAVLHQVVVGYRLDVRGRSVHRRCTFTGVTVRSRSSMPIARWAGPSLVPRGLVKWWKATQRYVRDHEAGHVAINREWNRKLRSRIVGAACPKGQAIIHRWSNQRNAAQQAYDKREYARRSAAVPSDAP